MSYNDFIKAMNLAKKCDNYSTMNSVKPEIIAKAEAAIGISFSRQLKEYLSTYGSICFFGVELYGINNENFNSKFLEGNLVEWTLNERKVTHLNNNWLPIRFEDDGAMAFLDFSDMNDEGEPHIILAEDHGDGYEKNDIIADDLGEYVLELVEWQLEDQ